ncbi:hypothetical protein D3C76_1728570 [compost metagenome]
MHGVGQRLGGEYRHVRRDTRQYLVARNQQFQFGAVETGMLGRVPGANHYLPIMITNAQYLAIAQTPVALRQR